MKRFKYYISPCESGRGWEVLDDEAETMGVYATQAEAEAAIHHFVADDLQALQDRYYGGNRAEPV